MRLFGKPISPPATAFRNVLSGAVRACCAGIQVARPSASEHRRRPFSACPSSRVRVYRNERVHLSSSLLGSSKRSTKTSSHHQAPSNHTTLKRASSPVVRMRVWRVLAARVRGAIFCCCVAPLRPAPCALSLWLMQPTSGSMSELVATCNLKPTQTTITVLYCRTVPVHVDLLYRVLYI